MSPLIILSFSLIFAVVQSARILAVFPTPSISHQVPLRPLTHELAKRHEVVVITTDPAFKEGEGPANLTEIDVHDVSYEIWRKQFLVTSTGKKRDFTTQARVAVKVLLEIVVEQLKIKEIQNLRNETFDLLFIEAWARLALIYTHFYKVPTIQISSFSGYLTNYETLGASAHPLIYPQVTNQRLYDLTLWEKLTQLYDHYSIEWINRNHEIIENKVLRNNFGHDIPNLSELANNVGMLMLNMHPLWDGNRPVPPSVLFIGGIHQIEPKELPKDLKSYLDSSKNGVIYISFGTNVDPTNIPPHKIQMLIKVFSQLPYDVLWKWNKDELPGKSKNIKISKWLPQPDLLRHPKIMLFITQCGLQSTDEAIAAGVPLLGIPMLGDQWYHAEKYVHLKIGRKLDMETLTEDEFKFAIEEIVGNPSYHENINALRNIMYDQPESPLTRAVWWTEHVLRHGTARHLRAPSANMSWTEYFEIDVVLVLLGVLLTIVVILSMLVRYVANYFCLFGSFKLKQH